MYLTRIRIENIRAIKELDWQPEHAPGWHVILGDNGTGKTSFLRSVAAGLIGPAQAVALSQVWQTWLREGGLVGRVKLNIRAEESVDTPSVPWEMPLSDTRRFDVVSVGQIAGQTEEVPEPADSLFAEFVIQQEKMSLIGYINQRDADANRNHEPYSHIWGSGKGWFSTSFGPFRRFTGGNQDIENRFKANPKVAAHQTLFDESVSLGESLEWLKLLRFKQLENPSDNDFLEKLKNFINHDNFLPDGFRLEEVNSSGVMFANGSGRHSIENLSDGFRSILSLTLELIRQIETCYGPDSVFDKDDPTKVGVTGVVLIDEIDAHLHPTWQRRIGVWFREHFPRLQFIVTTHSPLVCQAATQGSIFRLPAPGSEETGSMVTGVDLDRLLYGNVLDAFSTELFGDASRSQEGKARLKELAQLNIREMKGRLTTADRRKQEELRASLPTAAHTVEEASK